MTQAFRFALMLSAIACGPLSASAEAVNAGALDCDTSAAIGTLLLQRQDVRCTFHRADGGPDEFYKGKLDAYGLAIGAVLRGKFAWAVLAPSFDVPPSALAGSYSGLGAQASFGGGGGVNLLVGDANSTLTLQPLSAEGHVGANIAAGIARLTLRPTREARPRRVWDRWDD
jgi:hypothetical protein